MTIQDEIESYLNKAHSISFVETENKVYEDDELKNKPLIYFLYTDIDIFNTANIHKKISDFFIDGKSKFLLFVKNNSVHKIAIVNKINGDTINIKNPEVMQSINDFINLTDNEETIVLNTAFLSSKEFLFHRDAVDNNPVLLDGYSLVYD